MSTMPSSNQIVPIAAAAFLVGAAVATVLSPLTTRKTAAMLSKRGKPKKKKEYPLKALAEVKTDKEKFNALYPYLRDEILAVLKEENELLPEAVDWLTEVMDYTCPGGKQNRGRAVIDVYRTLKKNNELTDTEIARASVLGWSIEFMQAFFLVGDDVMDDSKTRRGKPCWYKVPKVGLIAINDSYFLESFVHTLIREHFQDEPYYVDLVELTLDIIQKTEVGQLYDLTTQPADGKIDLNRFTMERYKRIVRYKTAYYSFYLPTALGMIVSQSITDPAAYDVAKKVCCIMGEYFQIQDDYLDCFGDPQVIGKIGTDIQENKCSWLVVQALLRCTPEQRTLLEQNYGVWDDAKVAVVKDLYRKLELPKVFQDYEEESYQSIIKELDSLTIMPRDVFELLLKKIYKRSM